MTWTGEVDKATVCDGCKGFFLVAWRPAVWFCQDCRQKGKRIPGWPVQP